MIEYMLGFQLVLYLLIAVCGVWMVRHKSEGDSSEIRCLFLLTAVGGAAFYLAWEASGRYVLPYAVFCFPYAAKGMELMEHSIAGWLKGVRRNASKTAKD